MNTEVRIKSGVIIFSLGVAALNSAAAQRLRCEVLPMLRAGDDIVLDMKGVEFADTSGIGAICELRRCCIDRGTIVLAQCSQRLQSIFSGVPEKVLPKRYSSLSEATEEVVRFTRSTGAELSIEPLPSTVAFTPRLPIPIGDNRRTIEEFQIHGHGD